MANNGFDIGGFWRPAVQREFLPHDGVEPGNGVKIMLNLDMLTREFMEKVDAEFAAMFESPEEAAKPKPKQLASSSKRKPKKDDEVKAEKKDTVSPSPFSLYVYERAMFDFRVRVLAGGPDENDPTKRLIQSWDVVDKQKKPVPVTFAALSHIPAEGIKRLYNWAMAESSNPTKDEKKESGGT